jgi:hypothetical protein
VYLKSICSDTFFLALPGDVTIMNLARNGSAGNLISTFCAATVSLLALLIEYALGHSSQDVLCAIILLFLAMIMLFVLLCPEAQFPFASATLWSFHYILSVVHAGAHAGTDNGEQQQQQHHDGERCQNTASIFIVLLCCAMVVLIVYLGRRQQRNHKKAPESVLLTIVVVGAAVLAPVYIFHSECDNMLHGAFLRLLLFYAFTFIFQIGMIAQNTRKAANIAASSSQSTDFLVSGKGRRSGSRKCRQTCMALSALLFILYIPRWTVLVLTVVCTVCVIAVVYTRGVVGLSRAFDDEDDVTTEF